MEEGLLLKDRRRGWAVTRFIGDIKDEGKTLGYIAGPMVAVTVSQYLGQMISSMMVGHLGELSLSSVAIATSLTEVTGFSLILGMASGLETLCGQAYGAHQYKKISIHAYSAVLSLILICIPISLLWVNMGKFLAFIGQDPSIALEAGKYAIWMIPGLVGYAIAQPMMLFLQTQSLIFPMLLSCTISLCLHIPLCWVLVFKTGLGTVGAALSLSVSYWLNACLLALYIKFSESCQMTRAPISMEAFTGINEFLRIAVPSTVMMCLEWWFFEVLVLLAGFLPNPKLETSMLSICITSLSCLYNIPYGLAAAASTRVSNELGAGNPDRARLAARVVMFIAVTEAIVVSLTLFTLRKILGYAYSNEKEVTDYVMEMVPILCIQVIVDSLQAVLSGIIRGCGRQQIGAYVNLGPFYLIGFPLALGLGFLYHLGGKGIRIGVLGGAFVQVVSLTVVTSFTNWQKQANTARERIFEERVSVDELK